MAFFVRGRRAVNVLRIFWTLIVLWYEYGVFLFSVQKCKWPDSKFSMVYGTSSHIKDTPYHILVVADPQILDHRSYPGRMSILTRLTQFIVDLNLRKNWRAALHKRPDAVVFLGDMMDGGRSVMSDEEYEDYYRRFKSIFKLVSSIPQHFIPGNHDIGLKTHTTLPNARTSNLGSSALFSPKAHSRYVSHFSPTNYIASAANHTLVFLDAPSFVEEDYQRTGVGKDFHQWNPIPGGSIEFMKKFQKGKGIDPVVLFTHIPLYRPDGTDCGSHREKGTIRPGVGFGYQNTFGKHSTQRLLESISPSVIFSGDDHDYCEYTHHYSVPRVGVAHSAREVTVKSFSMVMNVRMPGFQLLSLAPEQMREEGITSADSLCLLPDQLGIYLETYIPLLVMSLFVLFLANVTRGSRPRARDDETKSLHVSRPSRQGLRIRLGYDDVDLNHQRETSESLPFPASAWRESRVTKDSSIIVFGRQLQIPCCDSSCFRLLPSPPHRLTRRQTRKGLLWKILHDVRDVAVFPLAVFVVTTWYMFKS